MSLKLFQLNTLIRLIPRLIFPAFKIGIFFENFFIKFSSFLVNPVVPITTFFFILMQFLKLQKYILEPKNL